MNFLILSDKEAVENSGYKQSQLDRHVFEFWPWKPSLSLSLFIYNSDNNKNNYYYYTDNNSSDQKSCVGSG